MDQNPSSTPQTPSDPALSPEHHNMRHHRPVRPARSNGWMAAFIILSVVFIIGGTGMFILKKSIFQNYSFSKSEGTDAWQSVFLTNGQVYFGHLKERTSKYLVLTNIYYLQVNQNLQQANQNGNSNANINQNQPQISLIKLGDELHGPKDEMFLSHDQILFWEDLKDDSKVVQAIKNYKK